MLSLLSILAFQAISHAGEAKKEQPPVEVSGVLFGRYTYELTEGADGYNEFAMDRVYVRADASINDHLGARVTLDADHFKDSAVDTKYRLFVKHAYLEWKDAAPGVKVRAGVIDAPLGPYMDDLWGHRYITDNFTSWAIKLSTADLGVGAYGKHREGLVDWAAVLVNGEGYSKLEVDAGKQAQARLTVDPLAGGDEMKLPITGFVAYAMNPDDNQELIASGQVGFEMPYLLVSGQVLMKSQADLSGFGYSAIALPRVPKVLSGVFRYDAYDPDTAVDGDASTQLVVGASHNFAKKVALALTYEHSTTEALPDTPGQGVVLHMMAGY